MTTEKSLVDSALRGWKSNVERVEKLFGDLSPGELEQEVAPEKNRLIYLWGHLAASSDRLLPLLGIWRKTSSRIRRHVHLKSGQVRSTDCLGTIAQSRMARNQPEAVGGFLEVLGLGLGAAAYCGVGTGFREGTASESVRGAARKNRAPCLSLGTSGIGAAKGAGYLIMKLTSHTILITGGGSGIGYELTKQLTALGNTILITGRDQAKMDRAKAAF